MEIEVIGTVISKFCCTHRGEKCCEAQGPWAQNPYPGWTEGCWASYVLVMITPSAEGKIQDWCHNADPHDQYPCLWDEMFLFFFFWTFWLISKSENIGPQSHNVPAIIRYSHLFSKRKGRQHAWSQWEGKTRAKCLERSYSLRGNKGPRWFWVAKHRTFRLWSPWHSTLNFFFHWGKIRITSN